MAWYHKLGRVFRRRQIEEDIEREFAFHIQERVEELIASGIDEEEAIRVARRQFGRFASRATETADIHIARWLEGLLQDVRVSVRGLVGTPTLTVAVLASLTIGIGANIAIFNLIDAATMRPLPVEQPEDLVAIEWVHDDFPSYATYYESLTRRTPDGRVTATTFSEPHFRRLRDSQAAATALIGVSEPLTALLGKDFRSSRPAMLQYVSNNFFRDLGVSPVLGRGFSPDDDRPGQEPAAIISYRSWTSQFGRRQDVLGQPIQVDGITARIIGVAPRRFFGVRPGIWSDVYLPLAARQALDPENGHPRDDSYLWVNIIARVDGGSANDPVVRRLETELRGLISASASGFDAASLPSLIGTDASSGIQVLSGSYAKALWVLQLLVGALFLIVCVNVANVTLARTIRLQSESALRLALGSSRARLFRTRLVESTLLSIVGGAFGLALGYVVSVRIHDSFRVGADASSGLALGVGFRLAGVGVVLALLAALISGFAPALLTARARLSQIMARWSRSVSSSKLRLSRILVSLQVALSITAVMAASLLGRTLDNLENLGLGIEVDGLSYATVNPWLARYDAGNTVEYLNQAMESLRALPGIQNVSIVSHRVLEGAASLTFVGIPGRSVSPASLFDTSNSSYQHRVGDDAFETLGITVLRGRSLTGSDGNSALRGAVIDERFQTHFFENESALGRSILLGDERHEIVGVAQSVRWGRLRREDLPMVYVPFVRNQTLTEIDNRPIHFAIRSDLSSDELTSVVRSTLASIDPAVPVTEIQEQRLLIDRVLLTERLLSALSSSFGVLALVLTAIGLGGLLAYWVARRTDEIGIRVAMGAGPQQIVRLVVRDSMRMVALGFLLGIPAALGIGSLLESLLFGLESTDTWSLTVALAAVLLIALTAAWLPARRAASIDPMNALREQ